VQRLAERAARTPRGVIVCGPNAEAGGDAGGADPAGRAAEPLADAAARLAALTGWPLLAEPTSGVRCGDHDRSHVVAHYDVLLRSERFAAAHLPQLALRVGDMPTSKPLRAWLTASPQVVIDPHAAWHEPTRTAELMLQAAGGPACAALAGALEMRTAERDPGWLRAWRTADALVGPALDAADDGLEPKLLAGIEPALPDEAVLWLSSSMPVRDVEACFPSSPKRLRFLANRGANGIDGVVSSAAGAALATGLPTFLLTGELALLHDLGGVIAAARAGAQLTIVCVNNGGGGIFDFLPVAEHADPAAYDRHIATPAGIELERVAALAGMRHAVAGSPAELREAIAGPGLVEVRTDRARNVALHRELAERVAAGL
jgi:2-succinyl-5-enolpyruvyl-6-hydroxy-3-cyclohexene-1-carboxylate synthase